MCVLFNVICPFPYAWIKQLNIKQYSSSLNTSGSKSNHKSCTALTFTNVNKWNDLINDAFGVENKSNLCKCREQSNIQYWNRYFASVPQSTKCEVGSKLHKFK